MAITHPDDLASLSPAELLSLARELRAANEQLRSTVAAPPSAAQSLLDEQLRRTSLLAQLAIEFRESLDAATIVEQTLRAVAGNLLVAEASLILVGQGGAVELATQAREGDVQPMDPAVARAAIDGGLAGWVLRHGSSVALSDVARDRRWLAFAEHHRTGSVIVIPVRQSAATLGVLTVHRLAPHAFSSHDLILLEGVAAQLGVALSAARHQAGERQRRGQAMALLAMSQFLTAERTPAELAAVLQEKSTSIFGAQAGFLFLADRAGELRPVLPEGDQAPEPGLVASAAGAARLAWAGGGIATTGPTPDSTCVALPLASHGTTIGAYALIHANGNGFTAAVWSLLTVFTNVVAAACTSMSLVARLTEQAQALEGVVQQRTLQLQRSRDALRIVFDSLREGILLLDAEERVLAANSRFCASIAGLHPREVVGRSYAQVWQGLERRGALAVELLDHRVEHPPDVRGEPLRAALRPELGGQCLGQRREPVDVGG
ncbi:MAG TPA: GAF domain-containing protein, partial [Chloroflexaceae bacterium]|nr:GAF domain-containing protein [Chloroflexaceae bacterium]